ncbi:hypothetical protein, partial [Halorubrum sp. Atlit-26R]|uniref:hypothetical protein n=1 Tax=Halorubrum sp. Atlit-26R TaxID=2282128 RepID=UPI000EF195EC
MRATAVGIGAVAGVGAIGSTAAPAAAIDWGDVGTIAATTVVGGPIGLGWALRETEVLGSNPPAEGLTADALHQQVYQTAKTRESTNASTFVDNRNILDGVENSAYTDAKTAAIEELNAGSDESAVLDAATSAIDTYETTVHKNFLKTWNEAANEADTLASLISDHPDLSSSDVFELHFTHVDPNYEPVQFEPSNENDLFTFPDGSEIQLLPLSGVDASFDGTPIGWGGRPDEGNMQIDVTGPDGDSFTYMELSVWQDLNNQIESTFQNVRDGIETWVTNVYSEVESGEIETSELITPRQRAEMLSDDESEANAISDLTALNIPIDPEREVTVTITETGATLSGTIGLTDESDGPIESGETYDPSTFAGDVYLTADVSQLSGTWDAYETGVDGGTITLTAQPYDGTVLNVTTAAGETVSIPASDWTDNGDGTYSYDASGDLETTTTDVESVEYVSAAEETQYETLNLTKEFTVESIVNRQ